MVRDVEDDRVSVRLAIRHQSLQDLGNMLIHCLLQGVVELVVRMRVVIWLECTRVGIAVTCLGAWLSDEVFILELRPHGV